MNVAVLFLKVICRIGIYFMKNLAAQHFKCPSLLTGLLQIIVNNPLHRHRPRKHGPGRLRNPHLSVWVKDFFLNPHILWYFTKFLQIFSLLIEIFRDNFSLHVISEVYQTKNHHVSSVNPNQLTQRSTNGSYKFLAIHTVALDSSLFIQSISVSVCNRAHLI